MRIELNARAGCYMLYCDTREEREKLRQIMQQPLTAFDLKCIDGMCYADTDSVKVMKTKLNSEYGRMVMASKEYIVVHRANKPTIIFKKSISAIEQHEDGSAVIYTADATFYVDDKYADVIKQIV